MEIRTRITSPADLNNARGLVMSGVLANFPNLDNTQRDNVELVIGELLANIAVHGASEEEVTIRATLSKSCLFVFVESKSIKDNCDKLSLALGHAQVCVDHGIGCDFMAKGHGLGHFIIARCAQESSYCDGTFTAAFDLREEKSEKKFGHLVDLALV